jgi:hemerythrin
MAGYSERCVLGFPEMDSQHDYCYRLFDAILPVAGSGDRRKLGALLGELDLYLIYHFESEERLMRIYEYPGFAAHQADHESAGNRFVRFLDEFERGALNAAALHTFLTNWLMEHCLNGDTGYVAWIRERRGERIGHGAARPEGVS